MCVYLDFQKLLNELLDKTSTYPFLYCEVENIFKETFEFIHKSKFFKHK